MAENLDYAPWSKFDYRREVSLIDPGIHLHQEVKKLFDFDFLNKLVMRWYTMKKHSLGKSAASAKKHSLLSSLRVGFEGTQWSPASLYPWLRGRSLRNGGKNEVLKWDKLWDKLEIIQGI